MFANKELFLTGLLNETLPHNLISKDKLEQLGIPSCSHYALLHFRLSHNLINKISGLDPLNASSWKAGFHATLSSAVNKSVHLKTIQLLMFEPFTRTVILEVPKQMDSATYKKSLLAVKQSIFESLSDFVHPLFFIYSSYPVPSIDSIATAYKDVRKMDHYRFTLGLNSLTLPEDFNPNDHHHVTLFNRLRKVEFFLHSSQYELLFKEFNHIHTYFQEVLVVNSTLVYVYKEILTKLIEHFYQAPIIDKDFILTCENLLWNFEDHFQDLEEIKTWISTYIIPRLGKDSQDFTHGHPAINELVKHLYNHYEDNLTLRQLSTVVGLSESYLSRLIKKELNKNFMDVLIDVRLQKATQLLCMSTLTIQDIALKVGYESPISFIRQFKKREGLTPSRYRLVLSSRKPQ